MLSGIVHVLKIGCWWGDCPALYGPSSTVYNRFNRWSQRGIWQRLFQALVRLDATDVQMVDSTTAKAHRSAAGGASAQAIGRSRGGRSTKMHAVADGEGRIVAFQLTAWQAGDLPQAFDLLAPLPPARLCLADTAYDGNRFRAFLDDRGTIPVIPNNPRRVRTQPFDPKPYRHRNLIERAFCLLKDWRRIATRYDKLAANYAAAIAIAAIILWSRRRGQVNGRGVALVGCV